MQSRYNTLELYPTQDFPIINTLKISIYDAQPSFTIAPHTELEDV